MTTGELEPAKSAYAVVEFNRMPATVYVPSTYVSITGLLRQKNPPNISLAGGLYLEIALKYKAKQRENGKFHSNYETSPIDFETQISLRR